MSDPYGDGTDLGLTPPYVSRYALVENARTQREAEAYLPGNYRLLADVTDAVASPRGPTFLIEGEDSHGWTLDDYVIPRYRSGLIQCWEIERGKARHWLAAAQGR